MRFLTAICVLGFLFNLGCGSDARPEQGLTNQNFPAPYDPGEGGPAVMDNVKKTDFKNSGFFNKTYNHSWFEAVLNSSGGETVKFAQALGVSLHYVPHGPDDRGTAYYSHMGIDPAPDALRANNWDLFSKGLKPGEHLEGLYFEDCGEHCDDRKIINPQILVHEYGSRYTLVHELMHHNFNFARKVDQNLIGTHELITRCDQGLSELQTMLDAYKPDPTSDKMEAFIRRADVLTADMISFFTRSLLEEIADEATLIKAYTDGQLRYVPKPTTWYSDRSHKVAMSKLHLYLDAIYHIADQETITHTWPQLQKLADESKARLDMLDRQADDIVENERQLLKEQAPMAEHEMIAEAYSILNGFTAERVPGQETLERWDREGRFKNFGQNFGQ